MEIKLTNQESEQMFYTALCDGLGQIGDYWGFQLDYEVNQYEASRVNLVKSREASGSKETICFEEVLMQMLKDGYKLKFIDVEGGDNEVTELTIDMVYQNISKTPLENIINIHKEEYDANDADILLQSVIFGEIVYG